MVEVFYDNRVSGAIHFCLCGVLLFHAAGNDEIFIDGAVFWVYDEHLHCVLPDLRKYWVFGDVYFHEEDLFFDKDRLEIKRIMKDWLICDGVLW